MAEIDQGRLEKHRITVLPESMFYIPDFITSDEEAYILDHVRPHL